MPHRTPFRWLAALTVLALLGPTVSLAQDGGAQPVPPPANPPMPSGAGAPATTPPPIQGAATVDMNFVDADLMSLLEYFARATGRNFILGETRELSSKKVTIISNKPVTPDAAYEAFLSALEVHGLTTVKVGSTYKIVKATDAQTSPGPIIQGGGVDATDNYVTQIITLENVAVTDVRQIIDNLVSANAKVLAYAPTNSLILTDSGNNLRRIYKLLTELDIAAPKSTLKIYPIVFADAAEIMQIIEDLYGTVEATSTAATSRGSARTTARTARTARPEPQIPQEGVTAGQESKYISKVLSDERTNSLIVLANEVGHEAVTDLIAKLDIDVDPQSRSQIYVYRLEHAKAEDVSKVLQDLSQGGARGGGRAAAADNTNPNARVSAARARAAGTENAPVVEGVADVGGAIAAFDSGMRIAADENTNALVIIASRDDYAVVESVIQQLDVKRKQVFVEAVIMELTSADGLDFNLAYHAPFQPGGDAVGIAGGQFGTNSLGFDPTSALSGLAFGVFGSSVDVPISDPTGTVTSLSIPAFGIALQAIKTMQTVNIVSSPSLMALDNEEAKIVVGRKIPFPTSNGLNSLGQPVISFQREDVAITLEVTPRVNSENFVTLELKVEVQEIEDNDAISIQQGGFITSKREVETVVLVGDNQTVVLGGLVGSTDTVSESKIPILGDLPLIGALFRNRSKSTRRTNLIVFLTPHIIDDDGDVEELMRVKEAQRQEFSRRFYGRSQEEQLEEVQRLLQYSMNTIDQPSVFRGPATVAATVTIDGEPVSARSRAEVEADLERAREVEPGAGAGTLSDDEARIELELPPPPPAEGEEEEAAPGDAAPDEAEGGDAPGAEE